MKKTKLALVIGHRKSDNGAHNAKYDITEWQYNKLLVAAIMTQLNEHIEPILIFRDDSSNGYNTLPTKINNQNPDHIIEFHCNASSNKSASGTEMLYYHSSIKSKEFAEMLNNVVCNTLKNPKRDNKPISSKDQNGYHLLRNTKAPCVITEPFFLSNDVDTANALKRIGELATALADALNVYFK